MKKGFIVWGLTPCGFDGGQAYTPIKFYPHEVEGVYNSGESEARLLKDMKDKPVPYKSQGGFVGYTWAGGPVNLLCSDALYATEGYIN